MMNTGMRLFALIALLSLPAFAAAAAEFSTLTNIPQLTDKATASDMTQFLNGVYKLCIGIAVVIAVLQLIRAGIEYMTAGGSIGSTEHAKHLISTSILGLVLVLSPYLVFSIVNPTILELKLDVSGLKPGTPIAPANNGTADALKSAEQTEAEARKNSTFLWKTSDKTVIDRECTYKAQGYVATDSVYQVDNKDGTYSCWRLQKAVIDPATCKEGNTDAGKACAAAKQDAANKNVEPLTCDVNNAETGPACKAVKEEAAATCQPGGENCRKIRKEVCEANGNVYSEQQTNGAWTTECKPKP